MYDSAKYLIHADIRTSGVVERSDVVGAVFGQTEGLLGDELDLRDLQESGKLGRIDVEVDSERGSSFGEVTIASGLDRVETAILAAALESIERVGPSTADVEIRNIEDVRSAKRRRVVERAKDLLAEFDATTMSSEDLVDEVRRSARVEDITEFAGLPAGPRVADSDAIIVVEGRADVLQLLKYGIKNAIAVEGTNVPDAVAELTEDRTVTAFLDGDRGGDLILKELSQVGDVDYAALAPTGRSVEDLPRGAVMDALRDKVPFETVSTDDDGAPAADAAPTTDSAEADDGAETDDAHGLAATDGSSQPSPPDGDTATAGPESPVEPAEADAPEAPTESGTAAGASVESAATDDSDTESATPATADASERAAGAETTVPTEPPGDTDSSATDSSGESRPDTLASHVEAVVGEESGRVRLLDAAYGTVAEGEADEAFDLVESAETVPASVVLDDDLSQRVLDVAAQRGVDLVVPRGEGEYVKQPVNVRIVTADEV
ncbi:DNA primase [Halosimplex carlsbadense 2-9-1]|uniref:DNA primase DnaG n=1 Tax=Halosimplex carlsbadense 2-9-1 TaxID=797114 RepID=M0CJT8_9EURY|nr:DNA primase DnaG [Halosimplex carlsbadense]ELZ23535.1 DNA primase [Halosimplex carlsbadense 2-9-1]